MEKCELLNILIVPSSLHCGTYFKSRLVNQQWRVGMMPRIFFFVNYNSYDSLLYFLGCASCDQTRMCSPKKVCGPWNPVFLSVSEGPLRLWPPSAGREAQGGTDDSARSFRASPQMAAPVRTATLVHPTLENPQVGRLTWVSSDGHHTRNSSPNCLCPAAGWCRSDPRGSQVSGIQAYPNLRCTSHGQNFLPQQLKGS